MAETTRRLSINCSSAEDKELLQFLVDRIPALDINAATIYLEVIKHQNIDDEPWFDGDPNDSSWNTLLRQDLLFRAIWFAKNHSLRMAEAKAIFRLGGMFADQWDQTDLHNWIQALIHNGTIDLKPDLSFKLSRELAQKAAERTEHSTRSG